MAERVRVSSIDRKNGSITITGIPENQIEKAEGAIFGQYYMTGKDGKLEFHPTREPIPNPVEDEDMLPFWRKRSESESHLQEVLIDPDALRGFTSPSIMISHLCGYHYTPERYQENALILESFGFTCMRSRRGEDGKYWENWYLPGIWAAKGRLAEVVKSRMEAKPPSDKTKDKRELEAAVSFLCGSVSFGTLDVVVQKAAMVLD